MHVVKLPEMEWKKYEKETYVNESGYYMKKDIVGRRLVKMCTGDIFSVGPQYAGPIEFDIPEPMPEPLQLEKCHPPKVEKLSYGDGWRCISCAIKDSDDLIVNIEHREKRVAVLAHNAAILIIQENTK